MHAHDIGHREQRKEIVAAPGERWSCAVGGRELRDPTADPPRPHDEHLLPLEALADHEVRPPLPAVAAPQRAVTFPDPPEEREGERDRMLGGRVRQDSRRVADDDSALTRGGEVDVVDPDRVVRDDAQLRAGGVEIRGVDRHRGSDDDPIRIVGRRDELERLLQLTLDLAGDAGPFVDTRWRHAYASSSRGACEDE